MEKIVKLEPYRDARGNEIVYSGTSERPVDVRFGAGKNNRLVIAPNAKIVDLLVVFAADDGLVEIHPTSEPRTGLRFEIRCGHSSTITIGENTGCAGRVFISACEGADVTIGADAMLSRGIELRTDDAHPIYDVNTDRRLNVSESIEIGEHVWLAKHVTVLGGVTIGNGTVVGFRSIVTRPIPNNCIAVGSPAKVVRRDIAWQRPVTAKRPPGQTGPQPGEKTEQYWNVTVDGALPEFTVPRPTNLGDGAKAPLLERIRSRVKP